MIVGKVIIFPVIVISAIIGIVYYTAFELEATDQARVTEISQSIESNFNEITRQCLVEYLDKEAMKRGYLSITENLEDDLKRRLREYLEDNYVRDGRTYVFIGGISDPNKFPAAIIQNNNPIFADDSDEVTLAENLLNGIKNINLKVDVNKGVSGTPAAVTSEGIVGHNYSNQYGSDVNKDRFPSIELYANTSSFRHPSGLSINPLIEKKVVGYYFTWASSATNGTNMYPIVFDCKVSSESYSDYIDTSSDDKYSTSYDNRDKKANLSYAFNGKAGRSGSAGSSSPVIYSNQKFNDSREIAYGSNPLSSVQAGSGDTRVVNFDKEDYRKKGPAAEGDFGLGMELDTSSGSSSQPMESSKASSSTSTDTESLNKVKSSLNSTRW